MEMLIVVGGLLNLMVAALLGAAALILHREGDQAAGMALAAVFNASVAIWLLAPRIAA